MKRKRHNPEQVLRKLRDADAMLASGKTIGQVCQAFQIGEQTFHRLRNSYRGMNAGAARRIKESEDENKRLKKVVAELALDDDTLQETLQGIDRARHPRPVVAAGIGQDRVDGGAVVATGNRQ